MTKNLYHYLCNLTIYKSFIICYNKAIESEVNKMKHTKLSFLNFIKLVEEGHIKVGRYEYERNVDKNGDSHYHRYYRKGDEIISEEVTPFK